jgi:hypothetical protein
VSGTAAAGASGAVAHVPADHRKTIARVFKMDHAGQSIKDAQISAPMTSFGDILGGGTVGRVCVRYRMKSSATRGEWTSHILAESFIFTKGRFANHDSSQRAGGALFSCPSDATYVAFAEINTD